MGALTFRPACAAPGDPEACRCRRIEERIALDREAAAAAGEPIPDPVRRIIEDGRAGTTGKVPDLPRELLTGLARHEAAHAAAMASLAGGCERVTIALTAQGRPFARPAVKLIDYTRPETPHHEFAAVVVRQLAGGLAGPVLDRHEGRAWQASIDDRTIAFEVASYVSPRCWRDDLTNEIEAVLDAAVPQLLRAIDAVAEALLDQVTLDRDAVGAVIGDEAEYLDDLVGSKLDAIAGAIPPP